MAIFRFLPGLLVLLPVLTAAEVRTGTIAAGSKWETPYYIVSAPKPGPTIVLTGGLHGNEPAGAQAAEQIRHWELEKGRLVVLPRVNQPGLAIGTRYLPGVEKSNRDLNRNFPKTGEEDSAREVIGKALWAFVQKQKPDWVIDLHEGYHFHRINKKSVGSTIIDAGSPGANAVIPKMLAAVNDTIEEKEKKFLELNGTANGSLARAAKERLGATSLILETTTREQPLSLRIRQHRLMVHTLFAHLGMIAPDAPAMARPRVEEGTLRVAIYDAGGVGGSGPKNLQQVVREVPKHLVWRVGPADIREGALQHFDLVIFPGGSGSKQAAAIGEDGRERVREFVNGGGGFVGVCAGAYLAASNFSWSLKVSNHQTLTGTREIPGVGRKSMWYRGKSDTVTMELTDAGRKILGERSGPFPVRYHNGPIMSPAGHKGLPEFKVLAHFRSEVSLYKPQEGTMVNTPAIIASECGKGRVLCISPHPESTKELRPMVAQGILWVAGE